MLDLSAEAMITAWMCILLCEIGTWRIPEFTLKWIMVIIIDYYLPPPQFDPPRSWELSKDYP